MNKNLAEIVGIMLGDGGIYLNDNYKIRQVTISGNSENDKDYLINYVKPLIEKEFNTKLSIKKHKTCKEIQLISQQKDTVEKLRSIGIRTGNKKANNVGIPDWIFKNNKFVGACLRGIIDTDGCVAPKTKNHKAPSIWITSYIPQLREDITKAFNKLSFHPSKWTTDSSPYCCLGKSEEVQRYFKEIGFSNPYQRNRFSSYRSRRLAAK